jgi:ribosomal protein S19E (S16A)
MFINYFKNNTNFDFKNYNKKYNGKNNNPSEDKIRKITIFPIDKVRKIEIEDLKALNNIGNISKKEENRLKELGLIKYRSEKAVITHLGIRLLSLIRNQKLKEIELYELLKKEQGKIPFSLLKK